MVDKKPLLLIFPQIIVTCKSFLLFILNGIFFSVLRIPATSYIEMVSIHVDLDINKTNPNPTPTLKLTLTKIFHVVIISLSLT